MTTKITKAFQLGITANRMIAGSREFIKKINMAGNGEDMQMNNWYVKFEVICINFVLYKT